MALNKRMFHNVQVRKQYPLEGGETAYDLPDVVSDIIVKDPVVLVTGAGVTNGEVTFTFGSTNFTVSGLVSGVPQQATFIAYSGTGVTPSVSETNIGTEYMISMTFEEVSKEDVRFVSN